MLNTVLFIPIAFTVSLVVYLVVLLTVFLGNFCSSEGRGGFDKSRSTGAASAPLQPRITVCCCAREHLPLRRRAEMTQGGGSGGGEPSSGWRFHQPRAPDRVAVGLLAKWSLCVSWILVQLQRFCTSSTGRSSKKRRDGQSVICELFSQVRDDPITHKWWSGACRKEFLSTTDCARLIYCLACTSHHQQ